jgi:hypothetical protein
MLVFIAIDALPHYIQKAALETKDEGQEFLAFSITKMEI